MQSGKVNEKGNKGSINMIDKEKGMRALLIANITVIIGAAISVGIYMATINQHSKTLDDNARAIELVDSKAQIIDKNINRRITEIAEAGIERDNNNEKSVVAIEGKLGRIEDKLDSLAYDIKDIKKIVLKPIVGSVGSISNTDEVSMTNELKIAKK
jgi:hypothetical protein